MSLLEAGVDVQVELSGYHGPASEGGLALIARYSGRLVDCSGWEKIARLLRAFK